MTEKHKIIIDSDTAGDDAAAIILAAMSDTVEILGVTVAAGNVSLEQAAKNCMAALELAGSDAPVYLGATTPLSGEEKECFSVYGKDGMGEADIIHPKGKPQEKNAIDFILDTIRENPGEIEIMALGPVTNIAMAIQKDRETMLKVKRIWSMGTAGFGPGNATPVAEFNVYKDAPAYKVMLELGVPVTVIGLDMDDAPTWTDEAKLAEMMKGSDIQRFIATATRKLLEFKKGNGIPAVDLPDAVAMGCLVWPDFVEETTQCYGSCITEPGETYGMVIFYKEGFTYDSMPKIGRCNVSVVSKAKKSEFVDRLNAVYSSRKIQLIMDADPGVDDALAMKIAFESPAVDVRLVCTVAGNVSIDKTTANALYLTKKYGGDIPVARGSGSPLSRAATDASHVHGASGIGRYVIPKHDYVLDSEDGVESTYSMLRVIGKPTILMTLGPLTNIATLFSRHPDAKRMISRIYAMIASVDGTGNITEHAEFNAYCDPEALDAVVRSGVEVVFVPMHLGRDARLSQKDILDRSRGTEFGDMLGEVFSGYEDTAAGEGYVAMYDANAIEAIIHPELYDFIRCTAEVDTGEFRGRTFLRPNENGRFFYIDIKDTDRLAQAMLKDMFP
jgi:purine nucleosidase